MRFDLAFRLGCARLAALIAVIGLALVPEDALGQPVPAAARRAASRAVVWPAPLEKADASSAFALLEAPRTHASARRVIEGFFDAIRRESVRDLGALSSDDATVSSGPGSSPEPMSKVWAARFRRLEYADAGAHEPYRRDQVGFFTLEEIGRLSHLRHFELAPEPGELLVVVPTRDRLRQAAPRHFGRRIELVLSPTPDGLRVTRMYEEFRLP